MSDMLKDETEAYVTEDESRAKARFGDVFLARFDYPLDEKGRGVSLELFGKDEETARAEAVRLYREHFGKEAPGKIDKFIRYRWGSEIARFCIEKYGTAYPNELMGREIEWGNYVSPMGRTPSFRREETEKQQCEAITKKRKEHSATFPTLNGKRVNIPNIPKKDLENLFRRRPELEPFYEPLVEWRRRNEQFHEEMRALEGARRKNLNPEELELLGINFDPSCYPPPRDGYVHIHFAGETKKISPWKMSQPARPVRFVIDIVGEDGDDLLIADTAKGYESRIHKSLIAINEFEVVDGKFNVSRNLYGQWFEEDLAKAFVEHSELFYSNIPLFVEKRDDILRNPRLCSIMAPRVFFEGMFIGGRQITLGEMLLLWESESVFSGKCDCGGRTVIYYFAGSPLSGGCRSSRVCLECGKKTVGGGSFNTLWHRVKCYPVDPFSQDPVSVKDLIAILKGEKSLDAAADADDVHSVADGITLRIGGKTVSNDTFASSIGGKE